MVYCRFGGRGLFCLLITLLLWGFEAGASPRESVRLSVPLVTQGRSLCGPATIEMVFRYWGISDYDQYDIAYNLLLFMPDSKRVKKSGILDTMPVDWQRYPGTGTINMREFLRQFSETRNHKFKTISRNPVLAEKQKLRIWNILKNYLSDGIPVIVHQYWRGKGTNGHYRVVTGYDDRREEVYLNDSNPGKRVTHSYEEFFELWNVDKPWLHYNMIVFNAARRGHRVWMRPYDR